MPQKTFQKPSYCLAAASVLSSSEHGASSTDSKSFAIKEDMINGMPKGYQLISRTALFSGNDLYTLCIAEGQAAYIV